VRIHDEIAEAYASDAGIPRERVLDWIQKGDLSRRGLKVRLPMAGFTRPTRSPW